MMMGHRRAMGGTNTASRGAACSPSGGGCCRHGVPSTASGSGTLGAEKSLLQSRTGAYSTGSSSTHRHDETVTCLLLRVFGWS